MIGAILVLVVFIAYTFREPGIPFNFLRGKKILHSQIDVGGKTQTIVIDTPYEALVYDAEKELGLSGTVTGFHTCVSFPNTVVIMRARPPIRSVDPITNKVTVEPRPDSEIVSIRFPVAPSYWQKFRDWLGGLFTSAPAQKGPRGGPTPSRWY